MKKYTDDQVLEMLTEYQNEFHRTTGKTTQLTRTGSWIYISYSGGKCRLSDIPQYIATLKARPDFDSISAKMTEPKTVVTLEMPANAAQRLIEKYQSDPEGFRQQFKEFGIFGVKMN